MDELRADRACLQSRPHYGALCTRPSGKNKGEEMSVIERVAKAIYENRNGRGCKQWTIIPKSHQDPYRSDARAALEAIKAAIFEDQ